MLFVMASLLQIRASFSLPAYGSDAMLRTIGMRFASGNLEKISLALLRWSYWFNLAIKSSDKPSDRAYACHCVTLAHLLTREFLLDILFIPTSFGGSVSIQRATAF